jgi:DNA-binding transcriptional LysR family regulator
MTLQQLQYFLEAARRSSFSAAAEALSMAQPSMSDQIRRLEAELGVPLFVRSGRGLELTEAGRLLQPHAGGTATFGTFGSAHHYLLSGLVKDFRSRYPRVRVRVVGQNSSEVADAVREGRLEGGLVTLPVDDRGLDVRPAMREEIQYVSADADQVTTPLTIEELAERPLILYDARWGANDPTRRQLYERAQRAGVKLEPMVEVEYLTAALDLAARGLGDTVVAPSVVESRGFGRRLASVSLDPPLYLTFAFITRRNAHLSPATRVFMELAETRVQALRQRLSG